MLLKIAALVLAVAFSAPSARAAEWPSSVDAALQHILKTAAAKTLAKHPAQRPQIRAALVDLSDAAAPRRASLGGERAIFAASLVKLAFAAAYFDGAASGRLQRSTRGDDLARRSLGPYDNRSPSLLVDLATGTRPGPALRGKALAEYLVKRGAPNAMLDRHGLTGFRAVHKLAGSRGRERQLYKLGGNKAAADDVARFMWLLWEGKLVDPDGRAKMLAAMRGDGGGRRDLIAYPLRSGLPKGVVVHSKAGWTKRWAHDAAIIVPADGKAYVLVVLTHVARPGAQVATFAREVHARLMKLRAAR